MPSFLTLWEMLPGERLRLKLLASVIPYSGNHAGTFDTFSILRIIQLNKAPFSCPLGDAGRGRPHLKLLALTIPYSGDHKERFDTAFSVGVIPINKCPLFLAHLKLLALFIKYSGNLKLTFCTVLALAPFP